MDELVLHQQIQVLKYDSGSRMIIWASLKQFVMSLQLLGSLSLKIENPSGCWMAQALITKCSLPWPFILPCLSFLKFFPYCIAMTLVFSCKKAQVLLLRQFILLTKLKSWNQTRSHSLQINEVLFQLLSQHKLLLIILQCLHSLQQYQRGLFEHKKNWKKCFTCSNKLVRFVISLDTMLTNVLTRILEHLQFKLILKLYNKLFVLSSGQCGCEPMTSWFRCVFSHDT